MRISDWSSDVCSSDLIAMVLAFTGLSETLRDLGLTLAAVQARHLSQAQKTALWLINVAAGAALWVALFAVAPFIADRKSVVLGKSVSVRVDLGWCRIIKKKRPTT